MQKTDKYAAVRERIKKIFEKNEYRYGYRRITIELHKQSILVNHKTVEKLMREEGLKCKVRMKKYVSFRGEVGKTAPNLFARNFKAAAPNEKWVTDITEFSLYGQKRYLSPIMDLYNGEIISYTISERPILRMVLNMLEAACSSIDKNISLMLHSDQGWHYRHEVYQQFLKNHGVIQSMSRKGNCLDNASMESFFGILKSELLYLKEFNSMAEFEEELKSYIDYYNNDRIKVKLNGLSPVQYRTQSL